MKDYIHKDNTIFGELNEEGKLILSVFLSGVIISEEEMQHHQEMVDGEATVTVEFTLSDILEHRLEYFRYVEYADKDVVGIKDKPVFKAMILELQAMIKTIEAIEFKE